MQGKGEEICCIEFEGKDIKYTKQLSPTLFEGSLEEKEVVIKFSSSYSIDVHKFMETCGCASSIMSKQMKIFQSIVWLWRRWLGNCN